MWYCFSDICQSSGSFEFINVSTFWFFLEDVLKIQFSEEFGKKLWKTSIFRRVVRLQEIFQRFPCILTKFLICFAGIFRICIFCVLKNCSPEAASKD